VSGYSIDILPKIRLLQKSNGRPWQLEENSDESIKFKSSLRTATLPASEDPDYATNRLDSQGGTLREASYNLFEKGKLFDDKLYTTSSPIKGVEEGPRGKVRWSKR